MATKEEILQELGVRDTARERAGWEEVGWSIRAYHHPADLADTQRMAIRLMAQSYGVEREDALTWHTEVMDPEDGNPVSRTTLTIRRKLPPVFLGVATGSIALRADGGSTDG
ncbi:MAG: hypothetical protein VW405_12825 [Rhodospirillaceae bacterium]